MSLGLQDALTSLLEEPPLDTFIKVCAEVPSSDSVPFVLILFPRFHEDEPDIQSLAEFLWHQAINYVLPLRVRQRAVTEAQNTGSRADLSTMARLVARTKQTFLKFNENYPHRASEVGELLAYLLTLKHLNAVQLASKMALKTNFNMPIHGLDGIHGRFSDGIMTLYFLEAKLAASAKAGLEDYAKSVSGFGDNRNQYLLEYEIIADLSNLSTLDEQDRETAMEYLDVYGAAKSHRLERSVGLICYTDESLYSHKIPKADDVPPVAHEAALSERLTTCYETHRKLASELLAKHEIDPAVCKLFLIAFPNVDLLRTSFYEVMNG